MFKKTLLISTSIFVTLAIAASGQDLATRKSLDEPAEFAARFVSGVISVSSVDDRGSAVRAFDASIEAWGCKAHARGPQWVRAKFARPIALVRVEAQPRGMLDSNFEIRFDGKHVDAEVRPDAREGYAPVTATLAAASVSDVKVTVAALPDPDAEHSSLGMKVALYTSAGQVEVVDVPDAALRAFPVALARIAKMLASCRAGDLRQNVMLPFRTENENGEAWVKDVAGLVTLCKDESLYANTSLREYHPGPKGRLVQATNGYGVTAWTTFRWREGRWLLESSANSGND